MLTHHSVKVSIQTNKQPSYIISLEPLISYLLSAVEDEGNELDN